MSILGLVSMGAYSYVRRKMYILSYFIQFHVELKTKTNHSEGTKQMVTKAEVRKLQRLGSKSLVVSLPRSWVKKQGLQPGDMAYVIEEYDKIIVMPYRKQAEAKSGEITVNLDAVVDDESLPLEVVGRQILGCMYILGIDNFVIKSSKVDSDRLFDMVRESGMPTAGVDIDVDEGGVRVSSIIDVNRLEPTLAIKNLLRIVVRQIDYMLDYAEGRLTDLKEIEEKTQRSIEDTRVLERLIMRSLIGPKSLVEDIDVRHIYSLFGAAILMVMTNDFISKDLLWMAHNNKKPGKKVVEYLREVREVLESSANLTVNPSISKAKEMYQKLEKLEAEVNQATLGASDADARMLMTVYHVLRIARIITYIGFCLGLSRSKAIERPEKK